MSSQKNKALKLWKQQNGICWICDRLMLPPDFNKARNPSAWTVTVDHIGEKDGTQRLVKGAHQKCNSTRHHKDISEILPHIISIQKRFANPLFISSVFNTKELKFLLEMN